MHNDLVSIIMPMHNSASYVGEAITSVLKQTYPHWELLVIEDASKDNSCDIVRTYQEQDPRIHLLINDHHTGRPSSPRNMGVKHAKGRYIAFLDSDDVWFPEKLQQQIPLFEDEKVAIVYSNYEKMDEAGHRANRVVKAPPCATYNQLLSGNVIGNRVYGLTFKERKDIPSYHPDTKVFEVIDKNGKPLALFYSDFFRRPTKRGGAWMDAFAKQSRQRKQLPVVYNVCNSAKAPDGQPSLITWDEVCTMFHEFGHALHEILSDCQYNTLSGTATARDFVEMPSQFNESFASIPEIFDHFARHTVTGEPMPAELKERMLESINFQTAYSLGENLASTWVDLAWHKISPDEVPSPYMAGAFEKEQLHNAGLLNTQIPPRYSTSYFNHVWGGGYAAGYYSYLWTEVLAVNIADYFKQHGALDPAVGQALRDKILSRGNTKDQMLMFTDFTGMEKPDASGLLKARGL